MKGLILRRNQVEAMTGLSRSTIYAKMKDGTFPLAVQLTEKAVGWRTDAIEKWIDQLPVHVVNAPMGAN